MNWLLKFLTSSIGQKIVMALTGLFLILFLLVHLIGNLQILSSDGGKSFNLYTEFMSHNPVIQTISKGNFFFILLHAVVGILIAWKNRRSKGSGYAVRSRDDTSWASRNMAALGGIILAFIIMHLGHFWYRFKYGSELVMTSYDGVEILDAYQHVVIVFSQPVWIAAYLVGLVVLSYHLIHGFASAFQTLGMNHKKYTPIVTGLGYAFAIVVPLAYAIIPIYIYFS